jgi:chaperonin GroEL (HSP60 family)
MMTSTESALLLCDEILFQYFVEAGAIAVRRVRKEDLRHVAKATGATMVWIFSFILLIRWL